MKFQSKIGCHPRRRWEGIRLLIGYLVYGALLAGTLCPILSAQTVLPQQTAPPQAAASTSTDGQTASPSEQIVPPGGRIYGTVTDDAGAVVVGALVTLTPGEVSRPSSTQHTNRSGFFNFIGLEPGRYRLAVSSEGFAPWSGPEIVLAVGEYRAAEPVRLRIAPATTSVHAVFSSHDIAEQQVEVQEKQRVLGVIPNFYTSYVWNAQPLSAGQKFRLAFRMTVDPVTIVGTGVIAGVEQAQDSFSGYGQGSQGYAKRFGASYADGFSGILIGGAILPSLLHQDPRYFYKGTGSVASRALYAISTVVICKGDNGRWQPNYSNVFGNLAAAGISNLYYPAANRGAVTIDNALIGTAVGAVGSLLQEFLIRKISRGVPRSAPAGQQP